VLTLLLIQPLVSPTFLRRHKRELFVSRASRESSRTHRIRRRPRHGNRFRFGVASNSTCGALANGCARAKASMLLRRVRVHHTSAFYRHPNGYLVGIALAILAAPAFYDPSRPFFVKYKGEWALISVSIQSAVLYCRCSFCLVFRGYVANDWRGMRSPLSHSTHANDCGRQTSYRCTAFLAPGTPYTSLRPTVAHFNDRLGAATAAAVYSLFSTQPVILATFGFLFSMPCFYVIVNMPQYATSGRFVLLTYNLTCLFCYNTREDGANVQTIAIQRSLAVMVGVLWAAFVSRFWWPTEARRELSRRLSE